jgi:hypothetical protein
MHGLSLFVHEEGNLHIPVVVGATLSDCGPSDPEVRRAQPLPYYLATLPSDKPKFAGADVPLNAAFDPPEAPGVRHFVRQNVSAAQNHVAAAARAFWPLLCGGGGQNAAAHDVVDAMFTVSIQEARCAEIEHESGAASPRKASTSAITPVSATSAQITTMQRANSEDWFSINGCREGRVRRKSEGTSNFKSKNFMQS